MRLLCCCRCAVVLSKLNFIHFSLRCALISCSFRHKLLLSPWIVHFSILCILFVCEFLLEFIIWLHFIPLSIVDSLHDCIDTYYSYNIYILLYHPFSFRFQRLRQGLMSFAGYFSLLQLFCFGFWFFDFQPKSQT